MKKELSAILIALLLMLAMQAVSALELEKIPNYDFSTPAIIDPGLLHRIPIPSFFTIPEVTPEPEDEPEETKKPSRKKVSGAEVTSFGLYFEEMRPRLTDEWYMFTPLDVSQDGVQVYPLVANNEYIIGEVRLSVSQGRLTVEYDVVDDVRAGREFFTLFPYLDAAQTVNVKLLAGQALPFEEPIDLAQRFGEDRRLVLYLNNTADFDLGNKGISEFSADAFRTWMQNMLPLLD